MKIYYYNTTEENEDNVELMYITDCGSYYESMSEYMKINRFNRIENIIAKVYTSSGLLDLDSFENYLKKVANNIINQMIEDGLLDERIRK